jgi:hypothetical protein
MTFHEYNDAAATVRDRAERIRQMRADRARQVWNAAFGVESQNSAFFLYAHNWGDQSWLTPVQRQACRFVRWMDEKQWEGNRIAERITSRMWLEHCRKVHGFKG